MLMLAMPPTPPTASTPGALPSHPQRTIQGRDAFADLDNERSASPAGSDASGTPRSLGSHAHDVASQAAAMKGLKLAPPMRRQSSTSTRSRSDQGEQRLPALPDAPTEDVAGEHPISNGSNGAAVAGTDKVSLGCAPPMLRILALVPHFQAHLCSLCLQSQILPTPPSETPGQPRRTASSSHSAADTSVEIEVIGASPSRMEAWRAQAAQQGVPPDVAAEPAATTSKSDDGDAFEMVTPAPRASDLPSRAGVSRTDSGRVDSTDPKAHEVQGPDLLIGRDEVAEKRRSKDVQQLQDQQQQKQPAPALVGNGSAHSAAGSSHARNGSEDATNISPSASHGSSLSQQAARDVISAARSKSLGLSPSPSTSSYKVTMTTPGSASDFDSGAGAGNKSQDAPEQPATLTSSPARSASSAQPESQSQSLPVSSPPRQPALSKPKGKAGGSIRRPPPGKMLSVADLDASDDEYEPGWASVISTSRS